MVALRSPTAPLFASDSPWPQLKAYGLCSPSCSAKLPSLGRITFGLIKLAGQASARFGVSFSCSVSCLFTTGLSLQGTKKLNSLSIKVCVKGTK